MSVNSITTVWCDGHRKNGDACGQWITGDTASDARKEARSNGWKTGVSANRGREDFCPAHKNIPAATRPTQFGLATRTPSTNPLRSHGDSVCIVCEQDIMLDEDCTHAPDDYWWHYKCRRGVDEAYSRRGHERRDH